MVFSCQIPFGVEIIPYRRKTRCCLNMIMAMDGSKVADYAEGEKPRVHFLGGKRACPPEDCGGVFGYYDLCEAVIHPYSARAREMEEWLGYKFDPEIFDKEETKYSVEGYNVE